MEYIKTADKVAGIITMSPKTYNVLLNTEFFDEENFKKACNIADIVIKHNNMEDKRHNHVKRAKEIITNAIFNDPVAAHDDMMLKTMYLKIVFAQEKFYNSIQDFDIERIAKEFNTDVETVMCKRLLDAKIKSLKEKDKEEPKNFTYSK